MINTRRLVELSPEGLMMVAQYLAYQGRLSELEIVLDKLEKKYNIDVMDFLED